MLRMNNGVQVDPNDPDGMRPRRSGEFVSDFYSVLSTYLITRVNEHMNAVYNDGEQDGVKLPLDLGHVVLVDGTLIRTRCRTGADNRRNYSGKHKAHGLLFLALTDDRGQLLWLSAARPGRSSEITTARYNKLVERLRAHELGAVGDLGFTGLDDDPDNPVVITGYKAARTKPLTSAKKQVNKLIASVRAVCEHAFAHLKNRRILAKLRLSPRYATTLLRALLVLTRTEVAP
ncbi:transposase family protein [Streptomyces barkulensis]|uniref:transposase family protein n=1 Tax=Streptomyces barkulensis TaxID=1257026 RepID=UPI000C6E37FE|nr:transposase family protein [Streptomyces barkulensis]